MVPKRNLVPLALCHVTRGPVSNDCLWANYLDRNGQILDPEIPRSELKKLYPPVHQNSQILDPEIPRSELKKPYRPVDQKCRILDPEIPRSELKKPYPLVDRNGQKLDPAKSGSRNPHICPSDQRTVLMKTWSTIWAEVAKFLANSFGSSFLTRKFSVCMPQPDLQKRENSEIVIRGVKMYRTLERGELTPKVVPEKLGLLTPKLRIFKRVSVERG